jgi:hypothetical protein
MNMMKNCTPSERLNHTTPRATAPPAPATWMEPVEGRLLMSGDLAASGTTTPMETCSVNFSKIEHEYTQTQTQQGSDDRPTESLSLNFTRL